MLLNIPAIQLQKTDAGKILAFFAILKPRPSHLSIINFTKA